MAMIRADSAAKNLPGRKKSDFGAAGMERNGFTKGACCCMAPVI
jgi:hypothetical protein